MKIKKIITILLIVAAATSYADERTDTIKKIDNEIDKAINKAIEEDSTNPYLNQARIKAIKDQVLAAIKKDLDEPGLTRLDIPEILPKINKEIKKIGDGIGPKNNFRIIQESKEVIQPIEKTAYEGFLRVVDALNRMNGIKSNYWEKGNLKAQRTHNGVDLVPIAHEVDSNVESTRKTPHTDSKVNRNSTALTDLAEKGIGAFSKEYYSELPYQNSDQFYGKRFYFGAGNTVNDIIFLDKDKFSSEVNKNQNNKNDKYYIEGEYKLLTTNASDAERADAFGAEKEVNPLDITMKEYRTRIEGKSKTEISAFLKEKLTQKNIPNVVQEGEELYTVDDKGRKWKVDWSLEPVSVESGSKDEYKDSVFTTIHYYNPFDDNSNTDSRGKLLYTKDGSIYAQDKNRYTDDVSLKLTETETKIITKIQKMVKLTKDKYESFTLTPAQYEARKNEFSDPNKYHVEHGEDDDFNEVYYIDKITKIIKEFEATDTEKIKEFKEHAQNLIEENLDKEIKETVKTNKDVTKNLNDFITTAKERAEKGEAPRNQFDQYFSDKKNLSKEDFENKWVKPFRDPEYIKAKENYERELAETTAKRDEVKKAKDKYTEITDTLFDKITQNVGRGVISYTDFYENTITKTLISEAKLEQFINSKSELNTEEKKNLVREYYKEWKNFENSSKTFYTLNSQVESGIAKKYGFWDNDAATPEQRKYVGLNGLIKDLDLTRSIAGKNIEFRGRGRIEGTVDLGEGKNTLKIAEQITGQYGTNIVLGPYAKLKNIDAVEVGGSLGLDNSQASISGRTSLTMDIDVTKKNSEGHYYQHALKDSDPNIRFIKFGTSDMNSRNDFMIELLTSKINDNEAIIDMGRKIDYTWYDMRTGVNYTMTIPFVSDSIAHQLINNNEFSKNGTSLLQLKTREELRRLNSDENAVYRSIRNANKLGVLAPTLTSSNKRTTFNTVDDEKEAKKKRDLLVYLKTKSDEDLINDLSQFNLSETEKKDALELIKNLKESQDFKSIIAKEKELNSKLDEVNKLERDSDYQKLNFKNVMSKIESDFDVLSNKVYSLYPDEKELEKQFETDLKREDSYTLVRRAILLEDKIPGLKNELTAIKNELKAKLSDTRELLRKDLATVKELKAKYPNSKFGEIEQTIETILSGDNLERIVLSSSASRDYNRNIDLAELVSDFKKLSSLITLQLEEKENIVKALEANDASIEQPRYMDYHRLKAKIFYTMREEEVLTELKNMLNQLSDRNIYSKLNKISKNEISTYTNIPFEITHALTDKKHIARGGFISNRTVQDNFKGNIYTAYGLYEKTAESGTKFGFMIGGANTKHNEVYQRSLTTVATESDIKGVSAYVGGYFNKPIVNNLNWITGVGAQYGTYKVRREMRNNYQDLHSEGKVNTNALNTYSGLIMNYPIQEDVFVQLKALLAYTMVKQSKVNESGDLPLDISAKTYHYVDGEAGISFNKIFYGDNLRSSISAGAYGITGLAGYKNGDMDAKIDGSTSSFGIKGDRIKKDAVKINLDYNVQTDIGYNYGLEGTYISNSKENNVKIGIKAGYTF